MIGSRSTNEVPIIRIEWDFCKVSLLKILTGQNLLFGAWPVVDTGFGIKILVTHQNNHQFSIFTEPKRYDFSLGWLRNIIISSIFCGIKILISIFRLPVHNLCKIERTFWLTTAYFVVERNIGTIVSHMLLNHSQIFATVSSADVEAHDLPHVFRLPDEAHLIRN